MTDENKAQADIIEADDVEGNQARNIYAMKGDDRPESADTELAEDIEGHQARTIYAAKGDDSRRGDDDRPPNR